MNSKKLTEFTHLYPVQKTLRFALKPVGSSLKNLKKIFDEENQTFTSDQKIQDAYDILKPEIDAVHEEFIGYSLESDKAKQIDFSLYWKLYQNKKENETEIEEKEKHLRKEIAKTYQKGGKSLKSEYPGIKWKKGGKEANGYKMMSCKAVFDYIKKKKPNDSKIETAIDDFDEFFTALAGFNTNRENYYSNEEKSTAIAHRIVNENLPKFCANKKAFEKHKEKYLDAHSFLVKKGKTLKDKEGNNLTPIKEEFFEISHFNRCLTQKEIESYNSERGNHNAIVNLYNQSIGKKDAKLPLFKKLFKQIGCGKKDPLFFKLTHDTKEAALENKENYPKPFSVEQVLESAKNAAEVFFKESPEGANKEIKNVFDFTHWLQNREDWKGIYWSKAAVNYISNRYLANWYDIQQKVADVKTVASFDKKREEPIKINDAVELSGLFEVLDQFSKNGGWEQSFFKMSILKDYKEQIDIKKSASQNLVGLLCHDIETNAKRFLEETKNITAISKYKNEENKLTIKDWMDSALNVCRTIKNFKVTESKIKGDPINPELEQALDRLAYNREQADWFKWNDALRNYLTRKPQDEAKENKLKLYFENPIFLEGWDKSKEESYAAVLLFKEGKYFLGIMHNNHKKLFKEENITPDSVRKTLNEKHRELETKKQEFFKKKVGTKVYDNLAKKISDLQTIIDEKKRNLEALINNGDFYQKMEYKFFPEASKMIPKCSDQLLKVKKHFKQSDDDYVLSDENKFVEPLTITKHVYELNNMVYDKKNKKFVLKNGKSDKRPKKFQKEYFELTKDEKGFKKSLKEWIQFCKNFCESYKSVAEAGYNFIDENNQIFFNRQYNDLGEFYQELKGRTYKIEYDKISKDYINECIDQGKLYVFEIYSKDFSAVSKGKPNLNTIYWRELFTERNLKDVVYKLNGKAELFYRKKAITYSDKTWKEGHHYERQKQYCKKKGKPFFPIIKDKRFAYERFTFHCSVTLNFKAQGSSELKYALTEANQIINNKLQANDDELYFMGLDRGEKNLISLCLVNTKGEIIEQKHLNIGFVDRNQKPRIIKRNKWIKDKQTDTWSQKEVDCHDYKDLLVVAEAERDYFRKNWQSIGKIRTLKEGYLSQVIHEITKIIMEKPGYIVLEDLSTLFKRGRQKVERQVYQKFELALAKKLNFLVDKKKENGLGSPLKALQLTPPIKTYADIEGKKQLGVMLYTRANYTSVTDPLTGWRKSIYLKKGNIESIKEQIESSFTEIGYKGKDYFFEYEDKHTKKTWRLWSGKNGESLTRYRGKRGKGKNEWTVESYDLKQMFDDLFYGFDKSKSLKWQLFDMEKDPLKISDDHSGWESLRFAIDLIQQIRNSNGKEGDRDDNFLYSPIRDENGMHYDSRATVEGKNLPQDADLNGAYNIARKGIIMHEHIKQWKKAGEKKDDRDLFISDEEWDLWLQDRTCWQKMLPTFASKGAMKKHRETKNK